MKLHELQNICKEGKAIALDKDINNHNLVSKFVNAGKILAKQPVKKNQIQKEQK